MFYIIYRLCGFKYDTLNLDNKKTKIPSHFKIEWFTEHNSRIWFVLYPNATTSETFFKFCAVSNLILEKWQKTTPTLLKEDW